MTDAVQSARALDRFAENLIVLRRRAGLSQAEAGIRGEVHRTEVSLLERRLRMPRLRTIVQLAGGVDAEVVELLDGLAWSIDPARRWRRPVRPDPEMAMAGGRRTARLDGGRVRVER
ncbi:MAG TPA: helix-turn-helix transcriptional regulator [Solirubrobacterales bacterium]|jgi:transcriptional regulator with XRE-family HTH domain|nr:helix-turn-helix transcriptional regulator [Solirubrobacterales bacterium]